MTSSRGLPASAAALCHAERVGVLAPDGGVGGDLRRDGERALVGDGGVGEPVVRSVQPAEQHPAAAVARIPLEMAHEFRAHARRGERGAGRGEAGVGTTGGERAGLAEDEIEAGGEDRQRDRDRHGGAPRGVAARLRTGFAAGIGEQPALEFGPGFGSLGGGEPAGIPFGLEFGEFHPVDVGVHRGARNRRPRRRAAPESRQHERQRHRGHRRRRAARNSSGGRVVDHSRGALARPGTGPGGRTRDYRAAATKRAGHFAPPLSEVNARLLRPRVPERPGLRRRAPRAPPRS